MSMLPIRRGEEGYENKNALKTFVLRAFRGSWGIRTPGTVTRTSV